MRPESARVEHNGGEWTRMIEARCRASSMAALRYRAVRRLGPAESARTENLSAAAG